MQTIPKCPDCGASACYFRFKSKTFRCKTCGCDFTRAAKVVGRQGRPVTQDQGGSSG